eukprot:TRINITY_DN3248_c0_g1_i2.p3 TRINITY_DN3248_c0_g1~~TRINITY_DN3248_c0_g1_i2.p3  ORF type:complete len:119 (+),score=4.51 TRINITY_DN3248_c0_g1_i2:784-1140(+)
MVGAHMSVKRCWKICADDFLKLSNSDVYLCCHRAFKLHIQLRLRRAGLCACRPAGPSFPSPYTDTYADASSTIPPTHSEHHMGNCCSCLQPEQQQANSACHGSDQGKWDCLPSHVLQK